MRARPVARYALWLVMATAVYATVDAQGGRTSSPAQFSQLECTFTASATGVWNDGVPQARVRRDPPLQFRIGNIDRGRGSADVMLGALSVPALIFVNGATIHFMQPPEGGETAIMSVVTTAGGTKFRASYSRTAYYAYSGPGFTSTPQAEQYYGYCVPRRD